MARIQDKEGFFGMDMDTATDSMQPGDYRFALNIRIGTTDGANIGNVENIRGNVLVSTSLPSGTNKVIGTYENDRDRSVIYFVWNSEGSHTIQQFFIDIGQIQEVVKSSVLNFQSDKLITGVDMISTIIEWTDNFNPPRKLNVEKANDNGKFQVWNLYFPDDAFQTTEECNYVFTVRSSLGSVIGGGYNVCTANPSDDGGLSSGMRGLADDINTATSPGDPTLNQVIEAEACGKFMKITSKRSSKITIEIETTGDHPYRLIADNFYSGAFREEYFDLIRYPQICQPLVEYKADSSITYNFLARKTFQFRTRFIYDDSEKSVWGSISELPIDSFSACGEAEESPFNYIEVDFSDDRLVDDDCLSVISKVDLAVREGNTGTWKKVITLGQSDFAFSQKFRFFNNGTYTEISQAESDKPFDNVPLLSNALSIVKGRTILGNNTEGYDVPCVDGKVSIDFEDSQEPGVISSIRGRVRIINPRNTNTDWAYNQPIINYGVGDGASFGGLGGNTKSDVGSDYNQKIPLKGFVAYLAGTNFSDVSVQNIEVAQSKGVSILPGNVFDGSGGSNKDKIKDAMDDRGVFSEFLIENVPNGEYILRLASHSCDTGTGNIFDINAEDLKFQRTSTRTANFLGSFTSTSVDFQGSKNELVINIREGGGTIDIGEIEVEALDDPSAGENSFAIEGYLFDPEFDPVDANTIRDKPAMELQRLESFSGVISTDHNGYFYLSDFNPEPVDVIIQANSIMPDGFTETEGLLIKGTSQALFEGGLTGSLSILSNGVITSKEGTAQVILYNHNTDVTSYCRTVVNGKVVGPLGNGVPDVNAVISRNTRQELTDSRGEYSILVYGDALVGSNSRTEDVSFSYLGNCIVDFPFEPSINIDVTPFSKNQDYDNTHPFTADDFVVDEFIAVLNQSLKRGGNYQYGIEYRDVAGRFTTIATEERLEFYIPFFTEDLNTYFPTQFPSETFKTGASIVSWEIFHDPPPWAVAYRWYRTENTLYNFYLQWVANDVSYVSRFDSDAGTPVEVSFGSSEAKEIYINIENIQFYKDANSDSLIGYTFQVGDRIRIMADESGVFLEDFFDFPIKEQRGFDVVIDFQNSLPELKRGILFEIYTPKLERTENIFREVGTCYDITDGQHSVVSGTFTEGDTYNRQRTIVAQDDAAATGGVNTFRRQIESASISDFYESKVSGIGRPNIIDSDSKQLTRGSELKFSNIFIEDTNINGLSSFDILNSKTLPQEFGGVNKIAFVNNVMLTLFPSKTFSLYINRSMVTDVVGNVLQAQSDNFFSQENELNGDYGTVNPESFVIYKGRAFWWDVFAGSVVQYDGNGTSDINYQMDRFFAKKGQDLLALRGQSEVVAVYDSYFNSYVITFKAISDLSAPETVVYNTQIRRWITFMSFVPEFYGRTGKRIVSFKDGELWIHNQSNTYNTIYGSSVPSQLTVIANEQPDNIKIWFNTTQRAINPWPCVEITNDAGQLSNLIESDFVNKEDDEWHAYLLRDQNTPNITSPLIEGDVMRSRVLELKLEIRSSSLEVLSNVDVYATSSERTNK